jgi:hypothetical protein
MPFPLVSPIVSGQIEFEQVVFILDRFPIDAHLDAAGGH